MNFGRYQALGRRIERSWQQAQQDERQFPSIAAEALMAFEPEDFDFADIAGFLLTTPVRQQPETRFSNLPVTVYTSDGFYLELLVWTRSTTSVHQHAFSGAFRVITGSSLHCEYRFRERERVNGRLLMGDIETNGMQLLRKGDVRPIHSGRSGLVHALFHLDEPSVTLVARTYHEPEAAPQYTLFRPMFAFDSQWADDDNRLAILRRWFVVAAQAGKAKLPEHLLDRIAALDPARVFAIVSQHADLLLGPGSDDDFLARLKRHHPRLAEGLADAARAQCRLNSLVTTRNQIKDANLRFFIALLLNGQSRSHILEMVRAYQPHADPQAQCVEWLLRIGDPAQVGAALRAGSPFLVRLGMALGTAGDGAKQLLEMIISGTEVEETFAACLRENPAQYERLRQAHRAIVSTPELEPLLNA